MAKRLKIKFQKQPAITINRLAFRDDKLVYVARANKRIRYPWAHSRIAYIGTTQKGARRIASSAAWKGESLLYEYGINHLDFNIVVCGKLSGVESWKKLERALIIRFREIYGAIPKANKSGKNSRWRDEKMYFSQDKLDKIIKEFG